MVCVDLDGSSAECGKCLMLNVTSDDAITQHGGAHIIK